MTSTTVRDPHGPRHAAPYALTSIYISLCRPIRSLSGPPVGRTLPATARTTELALPLMRTDPPAGFFTSSMGIVAADRPLVLLNARNARAAGAYAGPLSNDADGSKSNAGP